VLAAAGFLIPQTMDSGLGQFRDDPTQYRVAVNALQGYWTLNRNPIAKLLTPGARVLRVWVDPGHCHDPRARDASGDYRAIVQGVSWFGIAGRVVDVSCGGWQWKRRT
jgi:hypothetical protein